ncbi:MAG: hypothetical protein K0R08_1177 [Solimicrobium sp.]|jgi:tetratricopeptide (TPR) repeat protein|nr:hypothetical protein [Solimicrobium sp.]
MLPISQPVNTTRPAFHLSNSNSTEKTSTVDPHVINLVERIDGNRLFLEGLKRDSGFQNTLTLMHKAWVPEEQLLKFLTGKASLEECLGTNRWMIEFLVGSYGGLEIKSGQLGIQDHFLSESLAETLSTVFRTGYFESSEKTYSKMNALMQAITEKNNIGKLDLSNTDFTFIDGREIDCYGFEVSVAEFQSISVIKESKGVMLAESEIDLAFSKIEEGKHKEAIKIFEATYTYAENNCRELERKIIGDKLFEAALEIFFDGAPGIAYAILALPDARTYIGSELISYHTAARSVANAIERLRFSAILSGYSRQMVSSLEKAVAEKANLKYTAYFLGKVYKAGLYSVPKNDAKARKYVGIAAERVKKLREAREAYTMMLEAKKNDESVFSHVPKDIIDHITRLRLEAILAQPGFNKNL